MKCDLPINIKEIRKTREEIKVPVIDGIHKDSKTYGNISEAWKQFGKWMVAIEESKYKEEVEVSQWGIKDPHICIVLRSIGFTLYFYELIGDYKEEHYKAFRHIRLILDRVLVTNQGASKRLRYFIQNHDSKNWKGRLFPDFFEDFPQEKISKWSERIDEEIEEVSNRKFVFKEINRNEYWKEIINPRKSKLRWDVKGCYSMLLSALNTLRPTLPQENIMIMDDIILRCEHGYYLGFLLEKSIGEYENKYPKASKSPEATRTVKHLNLKLRNFRKGREKRVLFVSKISFGLTPEVKNRLRRMFDLIEVE
jgi:hypothetical protein